MISKLPDLLISYNILSRLSTEDAVRTSALSTQWRNLWELVPGLDLHSTEFSDPRAFVDFVNRFFDSHKELWIGKFKLRIYNSNHITKSHFSSWINDVTKHRIQQIEFRFNRHCEIPMSIYTCETLVELRLCWVALSSANIVSLPCLKILYLKFVASRNYEATVEKLISGSPVLEDLTILTIIRYYIDYETVIQVRSQTVKRIHIEGSTKVVIDAPLLQCLLKTYILGHRKNYKIISSGFLVKLDIQLASTVLDKPAISEILTDISKVRELVIDRKMWEKIFHYSKSEPLLQFRYLSRLNARYVKSDLELLPTLLESCPNLESLILEECVFMLDDREPNVMFSTVPQCLVSSFKFLGLKRSIWNSEYEGDQMELVRYFMKNSAILEKITIDNYYRENAKSDNILKELLAMPRCSRTCEIFIN